MQIYPGILAVRASTEDKKLNVPMPGRIRSTTLPYSVFMASGECLDRVRPIRTADCCSVLVPASVHDMSTVALGTGTI